MKELKVQPIRNGTVIDHIEPGMAVKVLRILGLPRRGASSTVTAAMNVPSSMSGRKDIVKIEDRELDAGELNKIALIAPRARINIVREYDVAEKHTVSLPDEVTGLAACGNPNCITNFEPEPSLYAVVTRDPALLKCVFCEREQPDLVERLVA